MNDQTQNLPAERGPENMTVQAGGQMGFGGGGAAFNLAPQSLGEVVGFAKLMAGAGHAIPGHLRNNPGACMAVTLQALSWQMSPFQVALQTYKVGDAIAYMAQVIAAVINARAGLKHRPLIEYSGEGPTRQCRVTFTFVNGDVRDYLSPMVKDIAVKNSPLWKNDPDQQLAYYSQRSAARRHCPEIILGVYDPDELEAAEPTPPKPDPRAPISMRAKLAAGGAGAGQGFDPVYIAAETGGEAHDATTGEIIEGVTAVVVSPGTTPGAQAMTAALAAHEEPPEPRNEVEQKDQLAAALASLDKAPAGPGEPRSLSELENLDDALEELGVAEEVAARLAAKGVTATAPDGADDLIRQNAYDDGYAGEPIDAVLVMCEDEREEVIARAAFADGQQGRIQKEAADHAASEAAAEDAAQAAAENARMIAEEAAAAGEPDFNDIAGPAPAGTKYLLASEEPAADGKLNLYQDGEVFSRIKAAGASKHPRYDGHPQPADPALATQSGGKDVETPAEPEKPAPAETPAAPAAPALKPNGLYLDLAAKESWLQIKPLLSKLYAEPDFQGLPPEDQARTRAHLFGAVLEMKERTKDPVDWAQDPAAFGLWLDWMAAGDETPGDKVDAINGTFQTLQGGKTWKERLTDGQRTNLEVRVAATIAKIKAT